MTHSERYLDQAVEIAKAIDHQLLERIVRGLSELRERGGRLFLLGVGGSAANCSHAANDFRKIVGLEAYSPCDNVAELTARTNDEGWETVFAAWLEVSRLNDRDAILIFSVGGGDIERNVSANIVRAIDFAKSRGAKVFGIVGKKTGYTAKAGDLVVVIPEVSPERVTPHSEAFQAVVWHCLVSHPGLQIRHTKW